MSAAVILYVHTQQILTWWFVSTFKTLTVRLARLVVNAYLENVDLVVRTIGEFGDDAERGPKPS